MFFVKKFAIYASFFGKKCHNHSSFWVKTDAIYASFFGKSLCFQKLAFGKGLAVCVICSPLLRIQVKLYLASWNLPEYQFFSKSKTEPKCSRHRTKLRVLMARLIVNILTRYDLSIFDPGWRGWRVVDSSDLCTYAANNSCCCF